MKTTIYNKLVRDKIPEIIIKNGGLPKIGRLSGGKFLTELKKKMIEEGKELLGAKEKTAITEELADILEVLLTISKEEKIKWGSVERKRKEKNKTRGGFKKKIFLKSVKE